MILGVVVGLYLVYIAIMPYTLWFYVGKKVREYYGS